jgi:hypothetical protein
MMVTETPSRAGAGANEKMAGTPIEDAGRG